MSRNIFGVVTQTLHGRSSIQQPIFMHTIECTRALLSFYMYARYKSHDDAPLSYMEDSLQHFDTFQNVFLLGRANKKEKANANDQRTELVEKRNLYDTSHAETRMPCTKRCEINTWRDYISHKIYICKELDTGCNYLKIDLMSHCAEQIPRFRALQQYCGKRHEQVCEMNLKDSWNAFNHNLNYLQQEMSF